MKLLIDMNLSPRWVETLGAAGFDAAHWSSIGAGTAPDEEILAHARSHNMVLLTHDLDFSAILAATGGEAPSVVQLRTADLSPGAIGAIVIAALRDARQSLESGAILSFDGHRARVRALPLR